MVCIILGFHRLRCSVAQWLVEPLRVPPRDPPEHRQLQIRKISERPALPDQLGLVRAVDGLGHGVVIRVADRAGRRQRPEFPDLGGVDEADVLRAMITAVHEPVDVSVFRGPRDCLLQRLQGQLLRVHGCVLSN